MGGQLKVAKGIESGIHSSKITSKGIGGGLS